ncbi:NTP transferase domain-containing protein [bacterium]|nr:NTP transferase domain-containing protein [bacterium]
MKAVIPAAGVGKRLRPHTLTRPKALLPVAGRPILAHIVDDCAAAGIDGFVLVVGHHGEAVRRWFDRERPGLDITYVEQTERLGLGHAVWTAREAIGNASFFCILGDTIVKADHRVLLACPDNLIGVREVADARRFGVVVKDGDRVTGFVEKAAEPPSDLAIVGVYLFRDGAALFDAMQTVIQEGRRRHGEYQLSDGLQVMLERGHRFRTETVVDWYDCGERETWLATNRLLLDRDGTATGHGPVRIHPTARVVESRLGPHVSVGPDVVIERCEIADAVIGAGSELRNCRLQASLVGEHCRLVGVAGTIDIGDHCELSLKEQP